MERSGDPEEEIEFYFKLAKPLALSLPDAEEKARAAAWLRRLREESAGSARLRADFLRLLLFALQRRRLVGVFATPPNGDQPLQPFPGGADLTEMMRRLGSLAAVERGAGDRPAVSSILSHDLKQFLSVQQLPHDQGTQVYMALSPDPYSQWGNKSEDRSRRRSSSGQGCDCSPTPAPDACACGATEPTACACAPAAAEASSSSSSSEADTACVCTPVNSPPSPSVCVCPSPNVVRSPYNERRRTFMQGPSGSRYYRNTSPLSASWQQYWEQEGTDADAATAAAWEWLGPQAVNTAADEAVLRAMEDADAGAVGRFGTLGSYAEEESSGLPPLWASEESGIEPMEWDSYHRANVVQGAPVEYMGGPVKTLASRTEVTRSQEQLADGSMLEKEECSMATAASRASPSPCPGMEAPRTSVGRGATARRVRWTPPMDASTPIVPCPARAREGMPWSPPSPILRCVRNLTEQMEMSPDSLEVSRRRSRSRSRVRSASPTSSRRHRKSPTRRSLSAESVYMPCPAISDESPPSGLYGRTTVCSDAVPSYRGAAGITSVTPPSRLYSSSRRGTTMPSYRGAAGITSVSPPSRLYYSSRRVSPVPSYRGAAGITSVSPPSHLYSSRGSSPMRHSGRGITSVSPPSGLLVCTPSTSRTSPGTSARGILSASHPTGLFDSRSPGGSRYSAAANGSASPSFEWDDPLYGADQPPNESAILPPCQCGLGPSACLCGPRRRRTSAGAAATVCMCGDPQACCCGASTSRRSRKSSPSPTACECGQTPSVCMCGRYSMAPTLCKCGKLPSACVCGTKSRSPSPGRSSPRNFSRLSTSPSPRNRTYSVECPARSAANRTGPSASSTYIVCPAKGGGSAANRTYTRSPRASSPGRAANTTFIQCPSTSRRSSANRTYCTSPANRTYCMTPANQTYCMTPANQTYCMTPANQTYCTSPRATSPSRAANTTFVQCPATDGGSAANQTYCMSPRAASPRAALNVTYVPCQAAANRTYEAPRRASNTMRKSTCGDGYAVNRTYTTDLPSGTVCKDPDSSFQAASSAILNMTMQTPPSSPIPEGALLVPGSRYGSFISPTRYQFSPGPFEGLERPPPFHDVSTDSGTQIADSEDDSFEDSFGFLDKGKKICFPPL